MKTYSDFKDSAPRWLWQRLSHLSRWQGVRWATTSAEENADWTADGRKPAPSLIVAEAVGSKLVNSPSEDYHETHMILLDIDVPIALVESSSNHHLYIDRAIPWELFQRLLDVLVECRVVEPGYAEASKRRGETFLRLPWVRKGREKESVVDAVLSQLDEPTPAPVPDLPF